MIKPAWIILLAATFLHGPAVARLPAPGLPGEDGRPLAAVPLDVAPWRGLLRVQTRYGARCTGFMIAPRIAVTAAHCLFSAETGRLLQPGSVHVLLRYRLGAYAAHAQATRIVLPGRYLPNREATQEGTDRALLLLDHAIAAPDEIMQVAPALPAPGTALALAGYGEDRDEVAVRGPPCRLLGIIREGGSAVLRHDCAGTHGTSGAPLLARDGAGHWVVVGVQIEARVGGVGGRAAALTAAANGAAATRWDTPSGR